MRRNPGSLFSFRKTLEDVILKIRLHVRKYLLPLLPPQVATSEEREGVATRGPVTAHATSAILSIFASQNKKASWRGPRYKYLSRGAHACASSPASSSRLSSVREEEREGEEIRFWRRGRGRDWPGRGAYQRGESVMLHRSPRAVRFVALALPSEFLHCLFCTVGGRRHLCA